MDWYELEDGNGLGRVRTVPKEAMTIQGHLPKLLLSLAVAILPSACEERSKLEAENPFPSSSLPPHAVDAGSPPPDPPREFRWLSLAPVTAATDLLEQLAREPQDRESRERLWKLYSASGYLGAARFFENTLRELEGRPLLTATVKSEIGWALTERDRSDDSRVVSRAVSELLSQQRYAEAVQEAQRDIEGNGLSLHVAVQWADAVLLASDGFARSSFTRGAGGGDSGFLDEPRGEDAHGRWSL